MVSTGGEREGSVADYYRDQTILVTGFTGYLGKQVVEKLLWSCPDLHRIYVLVRSKKGADPHLRIKQALSSLAFERLRQHYPERLEKVVGISGNLSEEGLGLTAEDTALLTKETSVVFHCAATVRFDETLAFATRSNILGTKMVILLSSAMPNLKSFNHVSTAYVNCDRKQMGERLYPAKMDWRELVSITDKVDEVTINVLTGKLLGVMPNTYVFTKALAEHLVVEYASTHSLPVVITRPSVVAPAESEPSPGWVDSIYGPIGIYVAAALGVVRVVLFSNPREGINYVYSDQVVRATIAAPATEDAWRGKQEEVPVYNLCSPPSRVVSNLKLTRITSHLGGEEFTRMDLPRPDVSVVSNTLTFILAIFTKHLPTAFITDTILTLTKQKPMLTQLRRRMYLVAMTLKYFSDNSFHIDVTNYRRLNQALEADGDFFTDLDVDRQIYHNFHSSLMCATKTTMLKEIFDKMSSNRIYIKSLYYMDKGGEYLIYFLLAYAACSLSITQNIFSYITELYHQSSFSKF